MLATAAARPWLRPAIVGWVSVAAFTGSTVVLLVALRPALRRGVGLLRTASLAPDVVLEESAERAGRADMEMRETAALAVLLSGLAVRKYRLVRAAVDLALLGLVLASVATGLAVWL
nr:Pycsar system effector family protein [Actinopolymorpha pittospori]